MRVEDWDRYWRFEELRRSFDPLDFRRWKRDSQRALRELHPGDGVRLLDATAGMGDHTVNLAEEGFVVEACDASPVARELTERALREAGLEVPVIGARWESLGEVRPAAFDLIFNDALHWTYERDALAAQLRGHLAALRPGGALVFFFADAREPDEGAGLRLLEWDWSQLGEPERVEWSYASSEVSIALRVHATRGHDFLDERHRFEARRGDDVQVTELTMRRVYRWDWFALSRLLTEVGFVDLRSEVFENRAKGYTFAMNHAFRPR
ncbi:MAG: class I SAM-dependent methyltransferase [Sandaracinus sp.]|nr:class I SAM-dependent methyltransferase [Sandaracinus sp.]MCB9636551.1 class I SAM-dependent methyltransferase [Sandaracinus sp.]